MRMNAQDQTPVSLGTFGRCVVCPVGAPAYRNKSTRNPFVSGELRAAGKCGGCARTAGMGGCVLLVGERRSRIFFAGVFKNRIAAIAIVLILSRLVFPVLAIGDRLDTVQH